MTTGTPHPAAARSWRALLDHHAHTTVTRAWPKARPDGSGELAFEWRDDQGRVRAGTVVDGDVRTAEHGVDRKLGDVSDLLTGPSVGTDGTDGAGSTDSAGSRGEVLVHRLGRRMVIGAPDVVTKVVRPGKAAAVAAAMATLQEPCRQAGIATPTVRATTGSRVVMERLPGRTLHALGDDALADWQRFIDRWPHVASSLDRLGPEMDLPLHDAAAEAATLGSWVDHLARFDVAGPWRDALAERAARICADLVGGRPDAPVVLHRDLHDKQVLGAGSVGAGAVGAGSGGTGVIGAEPTIAVLDVDTAARGEAALDLGNLLVHLDLRVLQGTLSAGAAARVAAMLHTWSAALGINPDRLATYRKAAALRLACVYAFRPSEAHWWPTWVERLDA